VVTVTGGKLTTYRRMAQQTVDAAAKVLDRSGVESSQTRHLRLIGAPANREDLADLAGPNAADRLGLSADQLDALVRRHGTETPEVLDLASGRPELLQPLVEGLPYLKADAVFAAREEMALTVDDVMSRRTRSVLRRATATMAAASETASMLSAELGRDGADMGDDARSFKQSVSRDLERAGLGDAGAGSLGLDVEQGAR
jgi:glycerol-3-phosphate dehydrogenase